MAEKFVLVIDITYHNVFVRVCVCPLSTTIIYVIITNIRIQSAFFTFKNALHTHIQYSCIKYSNQVSYVHGSQLPHTQKQPFTIIIPILMRILMRFEFTFFSPFWPIWPLGSTVPIWNMLKWNYKMNAFESVSDVTIMYACICSVFRFFLSFYFTCDDNIRWQCHCVSRHPIPDADLYGHMNMM